MGPWPENRGGEGGTPWARGLKTSRWGHLGDSGSSEGFLGTVLGRLGAVLEPSWGRLGFLLAPFGASGGHLGASWGRLGASWAPLGAILKPPWASENANRRNVNT